MPAISNITVKKADGTTDIIYTAVQPSSGDGVQAVWKAAGGTAQAHQPELRCSARSVRNGAAREVRFSYMYPETATDTTTGLTKVVHRERGSFSFEFDTDSATTAVNEGSAQFSNLLGSATAKAIVQSGYGPT